MSGVTLVKGLSLDTPVLWRKNYLSGNMVQIKDLYIRFSYQIDLRMLRCSMAGVPSTNGCGVGTEQVEL